MWGGIPLGWHGAALHCGSMGYVYRYKGMPSKPTGKSIPSQSTPGAYHVMLPHAATRESHASLPQGHPMDYKVSVALFYSIDISLTALFN